MKPPTVEDFEARKTMSLPSAPQRVLCMLIDIQRPMNQYTVASLPSTGAGQDRCCPLSLHTQSGTCSQERHRITLRSSNNYSPKPYKILYLTLTLSGDKYDEGFSRSRLVGGHWYAFGYPLSINMVRGNEDLIEVVYQDRTVLAHMKQLIPWNEDLPDEGMNI